MTFAELQTEMYARGFDYLNQDAAGRVRAKRWLNQAYLEIVGLEKWPFRESTASGATPLTISDLGSVESVRVPSQNYFKLHYEARESIVRRGGGDLALAGTPAVYFIEDGTEIHTFPLGQSVQVFYWRVPPELSADADTLIIPARYQDLVVDGAVIRGLKDSDNYEAVGALRNEYNLGLDVMRRDLLHQFDGTDYILMEYSESA